MGDEHALGAEHRAPERRLSYPKTRAMQKNELPRVSIADLLDEVRILIGTARNAGENPRYLMLANDPFEAVRAVKARDEQRGIPVLVLGMEVVRSDDPAAAPKVF